MAGLSTAFMNFTTGVLEADKKNTKENLLIRGKELDAKRNAVLEMKKSKYNDEIETYKKDKVKVDSLPLIYRSSFLWGHRYYGGISMGSDRHVRNYTEGKLAIDVYDVKTHQPVWHGWAVKRIKSSEQDNPSKAIKMVVEQVVAQF